jgi:hypothetical protein
MKKMKELAEKGVYSRYKRIDLLKTVQTISQFVFERDKR